MTICRLQNHLQQMTRIPKPTKCETSKWLLSDWLWRWLGTPRHPNPHWIFTEKWQRNRSSWHATSSGQSGIIDPARNLPKNFLPCRFCCPTDPWHFSVHPALKWMVIIQMKSWSKTCPQWLQGPKSPCSHFFLEWLSVSHFLQSLVCPIFCRVSTHMCSNLASNTPTLITHGVPWSTKGREDTLGKNEGLYSEFEEVSTPSRLTISLWNLLLLCRLSSYLLSLPPSNDQQRS